MRLKALAVEAVRSRARSRQDGLEEFKSISARIIVMAALTQFDCCKTRKAENQSDAYSFAC